MYRIATLLPLLMFSLAAHASDECRQHTNDARAHERQADAAKELVSTLKAAHERASDARKAADKLGLDDVEDEAKDAVRSLDKAIDEADEAHQRLRDQQRQSERLRDSSCKR